ncbi:MULTISPECIES: YcbK family protein [Aeromonas]|uniref:YcbK family protein n=1 Tax=Aeromonas TaxID=642 RepID=UPI0018F1CEA8|nr:MULTISPECIES: DUF882 domain-containing protein [Aeromonas]MDU7312060.1 DUF882 domain-containing protein [Aeromonas sp.]HAT2715701.1 DUF882 domain-containing protein [Aeromonas hydrophila]MBJ7591517.1 DUF882 domain-containing protein [Aeromonas veronii]MBL0436862.1 DUF882 domain-containing protein [Aeromonas caviae]MDN6869660.1 DUF882 domain-containing protein [Aeromonas caviae]
MERREALRKIILTGAGIMMANPCKKLLAAGSFDTDHAVKPRQDISDPRVVFWREFWERPRVLNFYRPESGERGEFCYWNNGQKTSDYESACWLLRDIHINEKVDMDVELLDLICGISGWFSLYGINKPFIVNSGYRSKRTNAKIEGAAKDSYHTLGKAMDGRIEGIPAAYLGRAIAAFKTGGVGFYVNRKNDFVHADVGRVRYWLGK